MYYADWFLFFLILIAVGVLALVYDIAQKRTEKKCERRHQRKTKWYEGKVRSLESEVAILKKSIKYYEDELIGDLNNEAI